MAEEQNQPRAPAVPASTTATAEDSKDNKKVEDLKFYPDSPTEIHHKLQFQT